MMLVTGAQLKFSNSQAFALHLNSGAGLNPSKKRATLWSADIGNEACSPVRKNLIYLHLYLIET